MRNGTRLACALVALAMVGAACTARGGGEGEATLDVSLTDFAIAPSGPVPADTPFLARVHNDGAAPHSMALVSDAKTFETRELAASESATLSVPALGEGTYTLYCAVPGHRAAGMESTLQVGGGGEVAGGEGALTPEQMDDAHEAGLKAFPAKTDGLGGQVMTPTIRDGVKTFNLTAAEVRWEVAPDQFVQAFAYNGVVPGPEIRVRRGDRVRVVLRNDLPESTSIHFHGLTVPNEMDGVPFVTQDPVEPGGTFTYAFTVVDRPGTHMYHSHHNAAAQVGKGLLGAFIVEPERDTVDLDQTMVLGDGPLGYTLNGKGFPATAPLVVQKGDRVRVRFMNEGQLIHPMHLHGFHFDVIARDGYPIREPYRVDTLSVAPGERYDVEFTANLKGVWAFHCHVLGHAESEHGMHGMVTAVIVQ